MGFNFQWIDLLMECITLVTYSFKVNGHVVGKVTQSRGLRQGDPLSPYLFVICSQGLSTILNHYANQGLIHGIRIARGCPSITQLFFADDSLIFFKVNKQSCDFIKESLNSYEKASGQLINYDKLAITFSKDTSQSHILYIKEELHLSVCHGYELYLGLPTFSVYRKRIQFGYIRDRVAKKIDSWKNRFFSEGGREVILKAIIQAIPTYAMSYFRIPSTILMDIEKLCAKF